MTAGKALRGRLSVATTALLLSTPFAVQAADVAVLGSPETALFDIHSKLLGTGLLGSVSSDSLGSTPTLAELQNYDAVMLFGCCGGFDSDDLGDNLADYMDGGGGVVCRPP